MIDPPASWPDDAYRELAVRAGPACHRLLLAERRWVHRRVEKVDVLTAELVRRELSVDLTVPAELRAALVVPGTERHVVPVATLRKAPLRNFSLRDEQGGALPLLGREHNGLVARAAVLAAATAALGGVEPSKRLADALARVTGSEPAEVPSRVADLVAAAQAGDRELGAVLADPAATFLLADLAANYLLLAVVEDIAVRRILKFGYDDSPLASSAGGLRARLGWRPFVFELDVPAAGRTASYHAQVILPEEVRFEATVLVDRERRTPYATDDEADRAALQSPDVPPGARATLLFELRAERGGFPILAFAVSAVTALLLALGAFVFGPPSSREAGPSVSVLLAASAFFAAAVARSGEHRLVQALFAVPRLLLALAASAALVAGSTLAFQAPAEVVNLVWYVAAATAMVVTALLAVTLALARPTTRRGSVDDPSSPPITMGA